MTSPLEGEVIAEPGGALDEHVDPVEDRRLIPRWAIVMTLLVVAFVVAMIMTWDSTTGAKLRQTAIGVIVSIFGSAALFVGANKLFDLAPRQWTVFGGVVGAATSFAVFMILWGNRLIEQPAVTTLVATIVGGAAGVVLSRIDDATQRLAIGAATGLALGLFAGFRLVEAARPQLDVVNLVTWTAIGAAVGAALGVTIRRKLPLVRPVLTFATLGWLVGAFAIPSLGGSSAEGLIAAGGAGALIGARIGLARNADARQRTFISDRARVTIFLSPALFFIAASLVIPTIRTIFLSLYSRRRLPDGSRGDVFVGGENYGQIFSDPDSYDLSGWTDIFTSRLFIIGAVLLTIGIVVGVVLGRRTGHAMASEGVSVTPMALGGFLVIFAVFTNLRGTIFNNLWWVFTVTLLATVFGLAIAVLADRAKRESIAKSLIFMPMAISFVGAGIIWRFMYLPRDTSKPQTGVLNSLWIWLGEISNSTTAQLVFIAVVGAAFAGLLYLAYRGWAARANGLTAGSVALALPLLFLIYRVLGPGLGGFEIRAEGVSRPGLVNSVRNWMATDGSSAIVAAGFLVVLAAMAFAAYRAWKSGALFWVATMGFLAIPVVWALILTLTTSGTVTVDPEAVRPDTIIFIQEPPFNNVWLMVVLIWIQTGFAMVILSAAIKAVPGELIEAAKVDGATESQTFWRVTIPQIAPTIGVVVTTLIVLVMKVFDIVKVMTNGNFDTQVIANEMWQRAFTEFNIGLGSALAVLLFLSVLPIMYINIRRMQKEAA